MFILSIKLNEISILGNFCLGILNTHITKTFENKNLFYNRYFISNVFISGIMGHIFIVNIFSKEC